MGAQLEFEERAALGFRRDDRLEALTRPLVAPEAQAAAGAGGQQRVAAEGADLGEPLRQLGRAERAGERRGLAHDVDGTDGIHATFRGYERKITHKSWAADTVIGAMEHPRIDISQDLEGEPVVHACFDLGEAEVSASAHAVRAGTADRFRNATLSGDEVLQLRELTALADELGEPGSGVRTLVMRPARLSAYRDAVARFVETRDEGEWIREEDREPLVLLRGLLFPLEQLGTEAMRAALSPSARQY